MQGENIPIGNTIGKSMLIYLLKMDFVPIIGISSKRGILDFTHQTITKLSNT